MCVLVWCVWLELVTWYTRPAPFNRPRHLELVCWFARRHVRTRPVSFDLSRPFCGVWGSVVVASRSWSWWIGRFGFVRCRRPSDPFIDIVRSSVRPPWFRASEFRPPYRDLYSRNAIPRSPYKLYDGHQIGPQQRGVLANRSRTGLLYCTVRGRRPESGEFFELPEM